MSTIPCVFSEPFSEVGSLLATSPLSSAPAGYWGLLLAVAIAWILYIVIGWFPALLSKKEAGAKLVNSASSPKGHGSDVECQYCGKPGSGNCDCCLEE